MYIKTAELEEIKQRLLHIENNQYKDKQFIRIRELIGRVEERYDKLKEHHWGYIKKQREFNKDFGRGKGVKAVKIERASDAPLESEE